MENRSNLEMGVPLGQSVIDGENSQQNNNSQQSVPANLCKESDKGQNYLREGFYINSPIFSKNINIKIFIKNYEP